MHVNKLQVKLFANRPNIELAPFVPVFHDWIKEDRLGELLVDVTDYSHVYQGPGVLLTGYGSDYSLNLSEGKPGLLYSRKRAAPPPEERLADTFRRVLTAARLLTMDARLPQGLGFRTDELLFRVPDRLTARNDESTRDRLWPGLEAFLRRLYAGTAFEAVPHGGPKQPFTLRVVAPEAPPVETLLARLG